MEMVREMSVQAKDDIVHIQTLNDVEPCILQAVCIRVLPP